MREKPVRMGSQAQRREKTPTLNVQIFLISPEMAGESEMAPKAL